MVPLQPGIPLPSVLPKAWPIIFADLKDCFFTIPQQEQDREKFAFAVLTYNTQPVNWHYWKVFP